MTAKPTLVFFKMFNCGHCTAFAERPTPESSEWATLLRDPEMQAAVDFVRYDFGTEAKGSQIVRHKLPDQYSFVNYGPYFYLHRADDPDAGMEFTPAEAQKYTRSAKGLKSWVQDKLSKDPGLVSARRPGAPPRAAAPVSTPPLVKSPPTPVETPPSPAATDSGFTRPRVDPASRVRNPRQSIMVQPAQPPAKIVARNRRRR